MTTVIVGEPPIEFARYLERRRKLGQDLYDEVWDGVYHVAPAPNLRHAVLQSVVTEILSPAARRAGLITSGPFNLGHVDDFRVPDMGCHRDAAPRDWVETAAIVVEVVSPGDESYLKFDHYAAHGVDEVLIVDPGEDAVQWYVLGEQGYTEVDASPLTGISRQELAAAIEW